MRWVWQVAIDGNMANGYISVMDTFTLRQWLDAERGRVGQLAAGLRVHQSLVSQYAGVREVPKDRAPDIEFFTDGAVVCETLRPDVVWLRVQDPEWPHPKGRPTIDAATAHLRGAVLAASTQQQAA